jgi:hypothetical protein
MSIILFNPIAPDRALTIATIIQNICFSEGMPDAAIRAAVNANGSAKMEWENLIIFRYKIIFLNTKSFSLSNDLK